MVINTNVEAQRTANYLMESQKSLQKSLSRLSSGSRIINASDDAAGLAVSSRIESQLRRTSSVLNNLGNAMSLTQTQDGFLKNVDHALTRMTELAMLARDGTKQDEDRALYNEEFQQLLDYVISTREKEFNGVPLFDGSVVDVVIDTNGNSFPVGGVDLYSAAYESALKQQSWRLTGKAWETSKSGYLLNQDTYEMKGEAFRLNTTLYYNNAAAAGSKWSDTNTTGTGTPYSVDTFVRNDGSTITEDPPAEYTRKFVSGDFTGTDLSDPNKGNGMFTNVTHYTKHDQSSFIAADIVGHGDMEYEDRSAVAAGHVIHIDPTTNGSSQDTDATQYEVGESITTQQDLSESPFSATSEGGMIISSESSAASSMDLILKALDQLHLARASLGAVQQRIEFTSDQIITSQQNLSEAKSRITDVDMAAETTRYAKQQILVQSGTQMLREANNLPQTALELLR